MLSVPISSVEQLDIAVGMAVAHPARLDDYFLGGKDNFDIDRRVADCLSKILPTAGREVRANRDFMHRAVRYVVGAGVRQFLDIGAGIPSEPNLHQVAQENVPDCRVVYVDNDPVVLAHARASLTGTPEGCTECVDADVRIPGGILEAATVREVLDFGRPVAVCLGALMHFIPDECDPHGIVATLVDALASGSYLIMSHIMSEVAVSARGATDGADLLSGHGIAVLPRSSDDFARFFTGLEIVEPGITYTHRWRPGIEPAAARDRGAAMYAAVARKP